MSQPSKLVEALNAEKKFQVVDEINQGANSYAFRARHLDLKHDVFLKLYAYFPGADEELLREPQVLVSAVRTQPRCDNLVDLYDADRFVCEGEEYLRLQMEFVDGPSLLTRLQQGPLGQQAAVRLVAGILSGVIHLHSANIVHRDLKPANIMQSGQTPKISDFGSASIIPQGAKCVSGSKHSALYVPPEAWQTPSCYSKTSDIYQVGVILYELANGPLCYSPEHYLTKAIIRSLRADGKTFEELTDCDKSLACDKGIAELATCGKLLQHGRAAQPFLSRKLEKVVRRATNADLDRRYECGQDFLSDVNRLSLPDWIPTGDGEFVAKAWREWDWRVRICSTGKPIVRKSRLTANNFRRVAGSEFQDASAAFAFVEGYGS
jgi:serine/threonine protein kinase